ncbi:MAG: SsrA-binding protein SmpB [Dehalococcoidia bacterium]|nr:SsrA-binding protein SmpB [Dehalococcoidia bacterium]
MANTRFNIQNRKAFHDYHIIETIEAGIALTGSEIKSIRAGKVSMGDAYVKPEKGELWLLNIHIARYDAASYLGHDPLRPRRLLLHRKQIRELTQKSVEKGYTLIPLRLYNKESRAKLEIALARGKKLYDKREAISERETRRTLDRVIKSRPVRGR